MEYETYVSLETAKLAVEKGFPEYNKCDYSYYYSPAHTIYDHRKGEDIEFEETKPYVSNYKGDISPSIKLAPAPSQAYLHKWLREKHNIIIDINWYGGLEYPRICFNYTIGGKVYGGHKKLGPVMDSYEEALEFALFEALKLINEETENN